MMSLIVAFKATVAERNRVKKGKPVQEILIPVGFLVLWFVSNRWVLPRFGVPT